MGEAAREQIFPRPLRQRRLIHRPGRAPLMGRIRATGRVSDSVTQVMTSRSSS
jgi:hypothetical protein